MSFDYFTRTPQDEAFYNDRIAPRLPHEVFDVHTHVTKPSFVKKVTPAQIEGNWALQTGFVMTAMEAQEYFSALFPGITYQINAFPFPIKEADLKGANKYIAQCIEDGTIASGFLCSIPAYDIDYLERLLLMDGFAGMKPLPDVFSEDTRVQARIFDLMTLPQFQLAEQMGKTVLMHLPRTAGMADPRNIAGIKKLRKEAPLLKLIIAHLGCCYTPQSLREALDALGEDAAWPYYDCSMVSSPEVYEVAFEKLPADHILFGTDEPIALWHGKQVLSDDGSRYAVREDFPWNAHIEGRDAEQAYVFFVYEQANAILDTIDKLNLGGKAVAQVFGASAKSLLGLDI